MKEKIIGRKREKALLDEIPHSGKSEFVAVCGRRRVGKTFLIKEFFEDEMVFQTSGVANSPRKTQLKSFYNDLVAQGMAPSKEPADWLDIFFMLRQFLENQAEGRKVVMLDELPWMDTRRSGFIPALEHFWNSWATGRHDIVLIVCGSATSWMMDKLINNHGGLYNRITQRIFLQPFTLRETEQMLQSKNINLSRYEVAELYMIMGGIPYYIDMLSPSLSLDQNIDDLLFRRNGALANEFDNLYAALFDNSADYVKIVEALSHKRDGLSRDEIVKASGLASGGTLSAMLKNLEWSGFVRSYVGFQSQPLFQLTDFYSMFYFKFLRKRQKTENTWQTIQRSPEFNSWAGLTFELLVLNHSDKVKQALGISGVNCREYAWRCTGSEGGAQIDMVIDRADNTINLCEMKFSISEFVISKSYEMNLRNKIAKFMENASRRKSIRLTMITTFGVERNAHSGIVNDNITLDDLFA